MADVEKVVARAIYCDGSYKQYQPLGCASEYWDRVSESQREFHRDQARAAIAAYKAALKEAGYVVVRESEVVPISRDGKSVFIDGTGEVPLDFGESDNDT